MTGMRKAWARDTLQVLHTLPPAVVTVVSLTYFVRLSEAQICAHTGWSADTVREAGATGLRELGRLLQAQYSV